MPVRFQTLRKGVPPLRSTSSSLPNPWRAFRRGTGSTGRSARDGIVIALTDRDPEELGGICDEIIEVPTVSPRLQPIVNVVPLQLLAYFIGVRRGADVDQPRNLAKSVTVE